MSQKRSIQEWATIHRALGNQNRLRILQLLSKNGEMSVSKLAEELRITIKNTSRNLAILSQLNLVVFQGKQGRVYYSMNKRMSKELQRIINITLS